MKRNLKRIALERIEKLLNLAAEAQEKNPELARRYVELAWKIKMRYTVRLPKDLKRKFCKKCLSVWIPGKTVRVRIRKGTITWTCLSCGRVWRMPTAKNKKQKRVK